LGSDEKGDHDAEWAPVSDVDASESEAGDTSDWWDTLERRFVT
jgi:hypothetical protein